ncbi:MAG: DUF2341 domain-containing protein [Crocinitomicaceae bacterium]|nr:DUF2341 domain-containing protein [Flavobacteriales bacterium]NQZ35027.1 DUF2341 domain-containing protein [Crocinitomicaceae bacterium]
MRNLKHVSILLFFCSHYLCAQPSGYNFGKKIEISSSQVSGSTDLVDFPVFLDITDPNLRNIANGGNIQSANGYDIIFTLPDCVTPLSFEIEEYNAVTGNLIVWVRLPALSSSINTSFFMYYGNSSVTTNPSSASTWSSNFDGVWHMDNDPSTSTLADHSGNGVNGTAFGSMTSADLINGKLGSAIEFDGSNDYFALATKSFTNSGEISEISVSAWINTTFSSNAMSSNWAIVDFDRSEYFNLFVHGNGQLGFSTRGSSINDSYAGSTGDLNDGNWHYVVGVYDGTNKFLYIDGVLSLTVTNPHGGASLGTGLNRFGFIGDGSEASTFNGNRNNKYYDGAYDEIRLLNSALTTGWIATEYNNQNNASSFFSVTEELSASDLCLILPIELGIFNAQATENQRVVLTWNTFSELNNDYFDVQRGQDGLDWEVIDVVSGAGNSIQEIQYNSIDYSPGRGTNYYRIRQVDFNGQYTYSPIRIVSPITTSRISVYPNPTNDFVFIENSKSELNSSLGIYNELGQSMLQRVDILQLSPNKLQLDLSKLSNGIYLITTGCSITRVVKR